MHCLTIAIFRKINEGSEANSAPGVVREDKKG